jgi:hypothetical protein
VQGCLLQEIQERLFLIKTSQGITSNKPPIYDTTFSDIPPLLIQTILL